MSYTNVRNKRMDQTGEKVDLLSAIIKGAISLGAAIWVWIPWAWTFMGVMMTFDVITGWVAGAKDKAVSSTVGRNGINQKALMFIICGALAYIDAFVMSKIAFSPGEYIREFFPLLPEMSVSSAFACYYGLTELVSGVENCQRGGIRIPLAGPFLSWAYKLIENAQSSAPPSILTPATEPATREEKK